jgi:TPR repeat protein
MPVHASALIPPLQNLTLNMFHWALRLAIIAVLGFAASKDQSDLQTAVNFKNSREAEQGDAEAQFSLGVMYFIGDGVEQSYEEAAKWYEKAADQGVRKAQSSLGTMYYAGDGVEQSYEEASKWYEKAAE